MQILTASQMYHADSATIKSGTSQKELMQRAGTAVVEQIRNHFSKRNVLVLCGPGNNGGDGFVIANQLMEEGWHVNVALYGDIRNFNADVARAAEKWHGRIYGLNAELLSNADLVVDALFGVGLSRPIKGEAADIITEINARKIDVISVDIPSGIDSDSGEVQGVAINAFLTVTFARKKVGHVLYPGKRFCGKIIVADIGIADSDIHSDILENAPEIWLADYPFHKEEQHKYDRGHAVVVGGGIKCTGAASLAAVAALRSGAGLVTVAAPKNAVLVYATKLTSVMTKSIADSQEFSAFIADPRRNTILIGPGNGVTDKTRDFTLDALKLKKNCVIDADALTVFADNPGQLFKAIKSPTVLTPHEGEFNRLFSFEGNKIEKTLQAAKKSKAVVVFKGADTIIASPDGQIAVNTNAPPWLATAGTGDVLAGIVVGLLANNMEPFKAACAAVWVHGQAATNAGMGMISEVLPEFIPQVVQELYEKT